jgi:hypothetical protein
MKDSPARISPIAELLRNRAAALLFPNRASGALHAVAMDRKSGFFLAPN